MRSFFIVLGIGLLLILTSGSSRGSKRKEKPYSDNQLFQPSGQRVFKGPHLKEIAFPLGGIGTGTVSLGGRGNLRDWEIFNRPGNGVNLPLTFFCLYFKEDDEKPVLRILEGPLQAPLREDYGHGYPRGMIPGMPRMEKAWFRGEYPMASVGLKDSRIPLKVTLEAFNPFIPLDPENSGIPGFVIRFRLKNMSAKRANLTVVGSMMNPIGFDGTEKLDLRSVNKTLYRDYFGQNLNKIKKSSSLTGLFFSSRKLNPESPRYGTMALSSPWKNTTYLSHWVRGAWFDDFYGFFNDLFEDGRFDDVNDASPSPKGRTDMGSLGLMAVLDPGEEVTLPFILTWHFPNFLNYFDRLKEMRGKVYRNNYALRFQDAWAAAEYFAQKLQVLEKKSRRFLDIFFGQTLPSYVLEAVSSQASTIRTPTCFWLDDGNYFGFEGTNIDSGCCPLNCTHVWNYAQSLAFLFPRLERSMRRTDFLNNVKPDGEMAFRTTLPLGSGKYWRKNPHPAADGQMGSIIRLYRDWQISGDGSFLSRLWPNAKKALEYAWKTWDWDRDGILTGKQHNTFDIEFYGVSSMTGTLYLGALLAGAEMAEAVGDHKAAAEYREVFSMGRKKLEELTWNGEYFSQLYDPSVEDKYQYGKGCVSDQIFGQWLSQVSGLGRFLRPDLCKTALNSIFKYNFRSNFRNSYHAMRTFALGNEMGLVNCSWPHGERPSVPFVYADEVWTGTEYQVASHLIYEGFVKEGLTIVRAIRERYDGLKRNPWNEEESGNHYVRAMSSWGVLLALTGFEYSGTKKAMGFNPKINQEDFRCFWSCGSGWGRYNQKIFNKNSEKIELEVDMGILELKHFTFRLPNKLQAGNIDSIQGLLKKSPVVCDFHRDESIIYVQWDRPVVLHAGDHLIFEVRLK